MPLEEDKTFIFPSDDDLECRSDFEATTWMTYSDPG